MLALSLAAQEYDVPEVYYPFAALDGEQETAGGSAEGYGDFSAELKIAEGEFCYMLSVGEVTATAAHIHQGKAGEDGAPVITLQVTGPDEKQCMPVDASLMKKIGNKPSNYYVNVHSAEHPAGAIRGQLED